MRRNFLPILGLLSLFVLGSCSAERDPKIASLKHAIGVADSQLLDAAAELDTTNCFPRSLMPRFRAVDAKDWTSGFFPGSLWQCYRFTGDEKLLAEAEKYTGRLEGIQYYKGTHDLGFMVFCSFGQQMQTLHDRHSEAVIVEAAKSLDKDDTDKQGRYIRQERYAGQCSRSFYVGDVKPEEIKAKYESGVLTVLVPKEDVKKSPVGTAIVIE